MPDDAGLKDSEAFAAHPDYRIRFDPNPRHVRATFDGATIVDSDRSMVMRETRHAPQVYVPKQDVRMDMLVPSDRVTHCPFKGDARYWHLEGPTRRAENAAWAYDEPYAQVAQIAGHIAFYKDALDSWIEQEGPEARPLHTDNAACSRIVQWLVRDGWNTTSVQDFLAAFGRALNAAGVPADRVFLGLWMLHPELAAVGHVWESSDGCVREIPRSRAEILAGVRRTSPLRPVFEGARSVRYRLTEDVPDGFDVLADLAADGFADYLGVALEFSDGQSNALSLATRAAVGFSDRDIEALEEVAPLVARMIEVHVLRLTTRVLLETYLGAHAGERVNYGLIHRGDGETIEAVVWLCDMRDSVRLTETLPRDAYLEMLNAFFDATAGAVMDHGGQVLRFVGDSVLAIFPVEDIGVVQEAASTPSAACGHAIAAVRDAIARIERVNAARRRDGREPICFGVALCGGAVSYGNVGAPKRLEFTVIGPAVNEAARLEAMTKELGVPVLISERLQACYAGALADLGERRLRGVARPQHVFTLPEFAPAS